MASSLLFYLTLQYKPSDVPFLVRGEAFLKKCKICAESRKRSVSFVETDDCKSKIRQKRQKGEGFFYTMMKRWAPLSHPLCKVAEKCAVFADFLLTSAAI
jgi:hypothetical protein